MAKKKTAEDIMNTTDLKNEETIDSCVDSADALVAVGAAPKKIVEPTLSADESTLLKEASRGKINFKITAGTEEVRNVNAKSKAINTGSMKPQHNNVVKLKLSFGKDKL